jgi:hypothetical protein
MDEAPIGRGEPVAVLSHATLMFSFTMVVAVAAFSLASSTLSLFPVAWPIVGVAGLFHAGAAWVAWQRSMELLPRTDLAAVQTRSMWLSTAVFSMACSLMELVIGLIGLGGLVFTFLCCAWCYSLT